MRARITRKQVSGTRVIPSGGRASGTTAAREVRVRRPAWRADSRDEGRPPAVRRRILVIEDDADAAESLRDALEMDGHEVAVAHNGPDGLASARAALPDVLLCDLGLPGMDGFAVARAFRADEALQAVFLIALSGYGRPDDLDRAAHAGFDRHLLKPPDFDALEALLRTLGRERR